MLDALLTLLVPAGDRAQRRLFALFALVALLSLWGAVALDQWEIAALPAALLLAGLAVFDFKKIYFLMLACIPVSVEMTLPGGLGTDLPSEPLMWLLTLVGGFWFLRHFRRIDAAFLRHPVTLALLLHLAWITVAVVASEDFLVSFKFLLAKGWYVIVFFFLTGRFLQEEEDFRKLLWWFYLPLALTVCIVLARHAALGFSFKDVNFVMGPFYRNHVMYACLLAVFLPFLWFGIKAYRRWSWPWLLLAAGIVLLLTGINFAYTRAAYVALVAAVGVYWVVRMRWLKFALMGFTLVMVLIIGVITSRDNWLLFAPDYERTVTHVRFDNLLEATTKLEDISVMERVYRWVAASYMIADRPGLGFGPGNFYFYYKHYTVTSFRTYVSDNPERSGIHNYYLMTAVEQGVPGVLIFIGLCFLVMLYGERVYHQTLVPWRRRMLAASLLSFVLIALLMLMNDFVETDKIGSLFFMNMAILVNIDLANRKQARLSDT